MMPALARVLPSGALAHALRRPVALAYHGVGEIEPGSDPHRLVVSPRHLEAHVRMLLRRRYRFLTATELLELTRGGPPPPRTALLTFDDGWLDGLTLVTPMLSRLGVSATFYVCPGMWGDRHPLVEGEAARLLDERDTRRIADAGMEIGSHTCTHPDLRGLDDAALSRELVDSKAAVEAVTGRQCRTLAYPYGLFDERVTRAAGAAGYELAWAWLPGPWRPLAAPRLPAPPRNGALVLALKLLGIRRRRP